MAAVLFCFVFVFSFSLRPWFWRSVYMSCTGTMEITRSRTLFACFALFVCIAYDLPRSSVNTSFFNRQYTMILVSILGQVLDSYYPTIDTTGII